MDSEYLLKLSNQTLNEKYNVVDFKSLEYELQNLRFPGNYLEYRHLEIIENAEWPFNRYWMWPTREQIESKLENIDLSIIVDEKEVIEEVQEFVFTQLLDIFKNFSLVSIILRFVWPEHYGIYSPPPLSLLRVERGQSEIEEYINYIKVLRLFQRVFSSNEDSDDNLIDIAKVDLIVWAVFYKNNFDEKFRIEFMKWFGTNVPANLAPEELVKYLYNNSLLIANSYYHRMDYKTAGLWASQEYEDFFKKYGLISDKQQKKIDKNWLGKLEARRLSFFNDNRPHLEKNKIYRQTMIDLKDDRNIATHDLRNFGREHAERIIKTLTKLNEISDGYYLAYKNL